MYAAALLLAGISLATGCKQENKEGTAGKTPVAVRTEKAEMRQVDGTQCFSGTVEEENGSALSFLTGGTIEQIHVSEGEMVERGQLLAMVDETSLRHAYEATLATRRQAEDAYGRMKQLHDSNSLPEMQWVEVQSKLKQATAAEQIAQKSLEDSRLYAPFSGFVSTKMAEVGQNVVPGMPVLKLVKIDRVKVKMSVPENEIATIKKGEKVTIHVPALAGRTFTGVIQEKGVAAHPLSRSYDVKALVNNVRHELLPGMVCNASLGEAGSGQPAIVLPLHVICMDSDNRPFVWMAVHGKATKRFVGIGKQTASGTIITEGLEGGEDIIVEGQQKVSEGMDIKAGNE